ELGDFPIERNSGVFDMFTEANDACAVKQLAKKSLALGEGLATQVLAVEIEQIEDEISELAAAVLLILLQQLEVRLAFIIEHDDFAVEHHIVLYATQCFYNRRESLCERQEIARVQLHFAFFDFGNSPVAVPFDLEEPAGAVEGLGDGCRKHWLDV